MEHETRECSEINETFNPSLTFHSPFSLLSNTWRFSIARCVLQTFLDFDSTERLLDAVVPFIALRPRIESMWKHGVHIGGKDTTFQRSFCVLQFSFAECHYWYTDSYLHKHRKIVENFYGIKLGLNITLHCKKVEQCDWYCSNMSDIWLSKEINTSKLW